MAGLPDVPGVPKVGLDRGVRTVLESLREHVRELRGFGGNPNGRAITVGNGGGGTTIVVPGTPGGGGSDPTPDYTPPPSPSGVDVQAGIDFLFYETDPPLFTQGHGYARTKVFGAKWPASQPVGPTFGNAVLIDEFVGQVGSTPTDPATRWCVWLKWVTRDGVESVAPAGGTNGFVVTTGQDPTLLLQLLTGQIKDEHLYSVLGDRIALIDAPDTTPGSVAARVKSEATLRQNADNAISSILTEVSATADGNTAAIQTEATTRATQTGALFAQYTVKLDVGGKVSGYGLASTGPTGSGSAFAIRADRFYIAAPAGVGGVGDIVPFAVQATPTLTPAGELLPAGTYIDAAYVRNLEVALGRFQNAFITNAMIVSVSASRITSGVISVGNYIQSSNYVPNVSGWRIHGDGTASFRGLHIAGDSTFDGQATIRRPDGTVLLQSGGKLAAVDILPDGGWLNSNVGGVNLLYGTQLSASAGPGHYGQTVAVLRNAGAGYDPFSLKPGEQLTVSAEVWQDGTSAAAGQHATLFLWAERADGGWMSSNGISNSGQTSVGARGSAAITLPASLSDMLFVAVGIYHQGGTTNDAGTVLCDRVQVERGATATQYKPGVEPGSTRGAPAGTPVAGQAAEVLVADAATAKATATSAAANASSALSTLATMRSNGYLDASEKPALIKQVQGLQGEYAGILARANAYGIVTERDAYTNAKGALETYLDSLSPSWADTSADTPITPATDQTKWYDFYQARQALLNKIAEVAGTRATWDGIDDKPGFGTFALLSKITTANASTFIDAAAIRLVHIDTATITNLAALTTWTGTLTVDAGGYVRSGKSNYSDTTAGFYLGNDGGVSKFHIGDANQWLRWTGTDLDIKLNRVTPSAGTISGSSFGTSSTIVRVLGTLNATATGGTAPYTYQWVLASVAIESATIDPANYGGISASGSSCTFNARGATNCGISVTAVCTVTDANGLSATLTRTAYATFGSGPP